MSYPPPPPPGVEPGYGYGYAAPRTNTKATWALVLGILSLVCCGLFAGIPAIILGNMAKSEIDASGGSQTGRGMAQAGLVLGIIGLALSVVGIVLTVVGSLTFPGMSTSP
jgi:putative exporter of polyketide antibiotics